MGKYSTAAWERRRIELQGNKLLYFLKESDTVIPATADDTNTNSTTSHPPSLATATATSTTITNSAAAEGGGAKKAGWFDQATALATFNLVTTATGDSVHNNYASKARGYIDIAKDKATVHSSMGHSGAPSPFALSIVVRGETKWKLCFDYHKTQIEWLAAISDVVVQTSVDTYNGQLGQLLEAADPANSSYHHFTTEHTTASSLLIRPPPAQPPSDDSNYNNTTNLPGKSHRLWMMENYDLSSRNWGVTEQTQQDFQQQKPRRFPNRIKKYNLQRMPFHLRRVRLQVLLGLSSSIMGGKCLP
jgi:hypothetical protein